MINTETKLKKLNKKLKHLVGKAIHDFQMIDEGDKVMVCLSGGKDSYTMLDMLLKLQKSAPIRFEIAAVNLDQKQPGFPEHVLPDYLSNLKIDFQIIEQDTYSIVKEKTAEGKSYCRLCSRMRRGILYRHAQEIGATKVALGHHREDIVETFFLNLFFIGKMEAMPAKFKSDDQKNIVIRPLAYCREVDIEQYSEIVDFPIIPCTLCGSQPSSQRQEIKRMLKGWEEQYPKRVDSIFKALSNVSASHLMDHILYDFINFERRAPMNNFNEISTLK